MAVLIILVGIALILYGTHRQQRSLINAGIVTLCIGLIFEFVPPLL